MVDRISNLPDELLCHILSFLPTEFAFRTTVLSKRWTPLFDSLPVLDFVYVRRVSTHPLMSTDHPTFDQFCRFVDNIMLSPLSTNQPLKKFCLSLTQKESSLLNFKAWLEAAKRRRVEELHIILPPFDLIHLDHCRTLKSTIFISQTLVVVKLEGLQIGTDTSSVHLPSLKTLHLTCVYFTDQNDYINFLSACPNVDDLEVEYIFHKKKKHDKIKSFTLSKLVKASIGLIYAYEYYKLLQASIGAMNAMFNGIRNVQFLRINVMRKAPFKVMPVFSNLIHIELVFCNIPTHWDDVLELLQNCPKIQILFIKKGFQFQFFTHTVTKKGKRKRSPEQANPTFSSSSFLSPPTEPTMVDRISNLPDELLRHMLSFLPTKFAFITTVLSKRWTPLFYSLPVLNFDISTSTDHQNFDQFCRFVDNIMMSPLSTNQTLKKFSLFLTDKESSLLNFNPWLEAATRRRVEELHIILPSFDLIHLNHCRTLKSTIFISQTLVVVKLECLQIGTDTSSVHLPSLKTLHLKSVYFTNQDDFINFLSACPNVDDLELAPISHKKNHGKIYPYNAPEGLNP
ncbi:hypothetical protein TSUD_365370 [Trifolium subterraneum]|uniref:F-box domain-containing protein n=1 Tax=Trifolium subterraneum TaxID=3900 RepID=A0A2Z6N0S7_TRISU|nr:hypothetical protein TSUD_365370 [Trifolium subterraneum]